MKDSIPKGWAKTTLGQIRVDRAERCTPRKWPETLFTLYSVPSFAEGRPEVVYGKHIGSDKQTVESGTVLVCKINPRINRVWVVADLAGHRRIASTEWIPFFPVEGVDPKFLGYALQRREFRGYLASNVSGVGGSLMRVGATLLNRYPYLLPPVNEQRRIVAVLDEQFSRLDSAVTLLKRVQQNLKRYRTSVLQSACSGKLVPIEAELPMQKGRHYEPAIALLERILLERQAKWEAEEQASRSRAGKTLVGDAWKKRYKNPTKPDLSDLAALPVGWVWTTVETICDVLLGRQRAPQFLTGRFYRPYLRVANVSDDKLDFSDLKQMDFHSEHFRKYSLQPGDILLSEGQSPELVGQSAIYEGGVDGLCFQKTLHRVRRYESSPSSRFIQLVFRAYLRTGVFRRAASQTVNIAHLTLERFTALPFPLPPLAEQERIVAEVERRLSSIKAMEHSVELDLRRAARLRQAILKRAFEGKLVPQDPHDEPACVLLERIRAERARARAPKKWTSRSAAR